MHQDAAHPDSSFCTSVKELLLYDEEHGTSSYYQLHPSEICGPAKLIDSNMYSWENGFLIQVGHDQDGRDVPIGPALSLVPNSSHSPL